MVVRSNPLPVAIKEFKYFNQKNHQTIYDAARSAPASHVPTAVWIVRLTKRARRTE